jgi:predicted secreted protein
MLNGSRRELILSYQHSCMDCVTQLNTTTACVLSCLLVFKISRRTSPHKEYLLSIANLLGNVQDLSKYCSDESIKAEVQDHRAPNSNFLAATKKPESNRKEAQTHSPEHGNFLIDFVRRSQRTRVQAWNLGA